jgi:hypothetical protein
MIGDREKPGARTPAISDLKLLWSSRTLPSEIYQLHMLLLQINPPIWRRLHVRSDSNIATLHELLQIAFDGSDFHLHRFVIRGKEYGLSRLGGTTFSTDARKVLLSQFHFCVNERFLYEYDFGDLWRHQVRFEGIQPIREKKIYPVCVGGACAATPEDCGGPEAYMEQMDRHRHRGQLAISPVDPRGTNVRIVLPQRIAD